MIRRGFGAARTVTRAASVASGLPAPVPPSEYKIHLPDDQYLHIGAPTEWWWNIGTLKSGDRIFGFEISAAGYPEYSPVEKFAFTQVMLSDVANAKHYQKTTFYLPPNVDLDTWAQSDPTKAWHAGLGTPAQGPYVAMDAPQGDPTQNMAVRANMADDATGTEIDFDLMLSQQGPPFMVFGTGVAHIRDNVPPLQANNYYYSLTRLQASGTVKIGGIVARTAHPANPSRPLSGGPQMVEISRDGKRVYFTNSLYGAVDPQFYPEGIDGWMVKLDVDPGGGIAFDPKFFVEWPKSHRPHQIRLEGGDSSSDSYCYP
jgi:hypothetical protein